jgi:hypothetical protein
LDVAVFWPGELSAHLREVRHWQGDLLGARSRGVLAATLQESLADSDATVLGRLDLGFVNEQLMHGDLAPWPRVIAAGDAAFRSEASRGTPRVSVDPSLPGHRAFEHLLNQRAKAQAAADRQPSIRLVYLDLPVTPPDSLARRLRELGAMPLFTIRCPVVCTPELRPYVEALGTDALVNMLVCEPAERRP